MNIGNILIAASRKIATANKLLLRGDFMAIKWKSLALVKRIISAISSNPYKPPIAWKIFENQPISRDLPLISVVIPCYNYGEFVHDAIGSIQTQTLKDIEIIVVDGGSTDSRTLEVLRSIDLPNVTIFFRKGRHYVGDNRNYGIAQAKGRYICCLDADDTIEPTYLEKSLFLIQSRGYDVVSTGINLMGTTSGSVGTLEFPDLSDLKVSNYVYTCAVFKKELWASVGGYFDVGIGPNHVAEDWDFWVKLAASGARFRNIVGEHLFNYRTHQKGSLSTTNVPTLVHQRNSILQRNRHVITKKSLANSAIQKAKKLRAEPDLMPITLRMKGGNIVGIKTIFLLVPFLMVGGAERLLSGLVAALTSNGWRVVVVATEIFNGKFGSSKKWFEKSTTEVYELPNFLSQDEYLDYFDYLMLSRSPHFILNAGSNFFYNNTEVFRKKYSETIFADILFNLVGHVAAHLKNRDFFDLALCESDEVFEWYLKNEWPVSKIKKLLSGVDLEALAPLVNKSILTNLSIAANDFVVGFSGRLSIEKAPDIFLEIAKLSDSTNLHFIMTGAGPMELDLVSKISHFSPNIKFTFLGLVDNISDYVASYDVLVLPSRADGRPLVVMEALASGVPVIATNVGALPELVVDGVNGYIIPDLDPINFYKKIKLLANSKELHFKMKKNSRIFAEQNFDAKKAYKGYELALLEAEVAHTSN